MLIDNGDHVQVRIEGDDENRLSHDGIVTLAEEIHQAGTSGAAAVLITGGTSFCAGRIPEPPRPDRPLSTMLRAVLDLNETLRRCPAVTVAAVKGSALGLGLGLALQSDIRVVSNDAILAFDEVERGIVPTLVLTWVDSVVSPALAGEMIYAGRRLDGREALALGLVSTAVATEDVDRHADHVVERIVAQPAAALATKRYWTDLRRHRVSSDEFAVAFATADAPGVAGGGDR